MFQVADSGRPALSSSATVFVRLIEESIHPPVILPLDVFVTTTTAEYVGGGVLGKIHATDQDVHDTLTYGISPDPAPLDNSALFSVSSADGRLVALSALDSGRYSLNATVTDGRFTTWARITVHVRPAPAPANLVSIRLGTIAPEEFVGEHWRNFARALRNMAGVRRSDVQLVSLQPDHGDLEVLLALDKTGSQEQTQEVVLRKLNASAGAIEEITGVRIVRVGTKLCPRLDCPAHHCQETVTLETGAMATYSTARLSFVTPRHTRTADCLCHGNTHSSFPLTQVIRINTQRVFNGSVVLKVLSAPS